MDRNQIYIFFLSKFISGNHGPIEAASVSPAPMVTYLRLLIAQLSHLTGSHSKKQILHLDLIDMHMNATKNSQNSAVFTARNTP